MEEVPMINSYDFVCPVMFHLVIIIKSRFKFVQSVFPIGKLAVVGGAASDWPVQK